MKMFLQRGVPQSMQIDGWWLDGDIGAPPRDVQNRVTGGWPERLAVLVALVGLADMLVWQVAALGLSLFVFGLAVLGGAQAVAGRDDLRGLMLAGVLMLPVVEQVQALSLMFWAAGLVLGAAWIALGEVGLRALLRAAARFVMVGPVQVWADLRFGVLGATGAVDMAGHGRRIALAWGLPLGLGLVFVALLVDANPMLESWAYWLGDFDWLQGLDLSRLLFWAGVGLLIWPFLSLLAMTERMQRRFDLPAPQTLPAFFNDSSVRRSLVLFNAVFAVQTLMDMAYLWGGVTLPDGLSYAAYAHRGAYPLLVTALLAGAFAVLSRPFAVRDGLLRVVLLAWVLQTVMLVISSLFRLDLYIGVYGLTRLRMAAAIWMMLVAAGLGLVVWQVLRNHTAGWMLARAALLGTGTVFACCFISFDARIARYNLGHDVPLDMVYLCNLGPAALPALHEYQMGDGVNLCGASGPQVEEIADWREWGFRRWRILRSVAALTPLPEGEAR